jgi:hypothetical protein
MTHKRPSEPIAPATLPGEPTDPKIPPEQQPDRDKSRDELDDPEGANTEI